MSKARLIVEDILQEFQNNGHNHEETLKYGEERIREYKDACIQNEQNTTASDCCGVSCGTSGSVGSDKKSLLQLREKHEKIAEKYNEVAAIHIEQSKLIYKLLRLQDENLNRT